MENTSVPDIDHSQHAGWRPRVVPGEYVPYRPNNPNNNTKQKPPKPPKTIDPSNLPNGKRSLTGISARSFILGQAFAFCTSLSILLCYTSNALWRAPFFIATLALFHFLEFYITARYNPLHASVSKFLLSRNGVAYNVAHGSALTECILSRLFLSDEYFARTSAVFGGVKLQIGLGLFFIAIGQIVRSLAMVQAGTNFNHTVQVEHKEGHVLVKDGIYSIFRHPSYFGFFWWGLGTQLVLGNTVCFLGYAVVLWRFFSSRIKREEQMLVKFFGKDYIEYRSKTRVGIPGIP